MLARLGLPARRVRPDQVLDTAIDVIPQFAIEILFQPVAPAAKEIEKLRHAYAPSLKISRTAAVN